MSQEYTLHPNQISAWKKHLSQGASSVFDGNALKRHQEEVEAREQELYARIGQLQMELKWVKKSWACRTLGRDAASIGRSFSYEPVLEIAHDLALMRLLDEQYLQTPFYEYRRMRRICRCKG